MFSFDRCNSASSGTLATASATDREYAEPEGMSLAI